MGSPPGEPTQERTNTMVMGNVLVKSRDRYIGRTKEGSRIYISMELRKKNIRRDTMTGLPVFMESVDHRKVGEYLELSITGLEVPKYCRNAYSAGQIDMHITPADFVRGKTAIPMDMIEEIWSLWDRYHLNGMVPHCIHQDKGAHVSFNGGWKKGDVWEYMKEEQTSKCPKGYAYGSKWLVDVIPHETIDRIKQIIDRLNEQPEYEGA